jgi:hypothetical protein
MRVRPLAPSGCLRCRQDARSAARAKRVRLATRAGLAVMGVVVVIALIVGAWNAIASGNAGGTAPADAQVSASGAVETPARPAARENAVAGIEPAIPEGRRDLGDSMYAVREGTQVTVYFDTDSLRTRFDWKFEGVVRATLPLVFGPEIRGALDSIPSGSLASGGNLVHELPSRGIPIRLGNHTLRVWPVTRQGRDGPLVMAYRAVPFPSR